ncbi:MAG: DUF3332 domain-containing protein [Salinivirgaceae bacterium]|nr:DUF3332 domain-containing protein [Salinivirgaceae bacterium]
MKKVSIILFAVLFAGMSVFMSGCYGSFTLTKKVHQWNGSLGNKFVEEAVFLLLNCGVYEATVFVDAFILNLIEFWTGDNPLGLHEGVNKVNIGGNDLTILLKNNKATILDAQDQELAVLNFNESDQTWYSTIEGNTQKLMTITENQVQLYTASGKTVTVDKADLHSKNTLENYRELVAMK